MRDHTSLRKPLICNEWTSGKPPKHLVWIFSKHIGGGTVKGPHS